ncbi:ATP-binding protein [Elusimicrobiota bacterium]
MKAKRKIVKIDEDKCDGCGLCVPNCAEGALRIIDGKARLVKEIYCDGLGACLGHCPNDAITIEERQADGFDEKATEKHIKALESKKASKHNAQTPCACPSAHAMSITPKKARKSNGSAGNIEPEPAQWPVQLMLVPPNAPYFKNADLLIAADCAPFAYADFHRKLLKGKAIVIGCPKLDDGQYYVEKLSQIISASNIKSITIAHMEVPCCFGLNRIVSEAVALSGRNMPVNEATVTVRGELLESKV